MLDMKSEESDTAGLDNRSERMAGTKKLPGEEQNSWLPVSTGPRPSDSTN